MVLFPSLFVFGLVWLPRVKLFFQICTTNISFAIVFSALPLANHLLEISTSREISPNCHGKLAIFLKYNDTDQPQVTA